MLAYSRHFPVLLIMLTVLVLHVQMWRWLTAGRSNRLKWAASMALAAVAGLLGAGFSLGLTRVVRTMPAGPWMAWVRAAALGWALVSLGFFVALWLWRGIPGFDPGRRRLLKTASGLAVATPLAAAGFGAFVERVRLTARLVDLPVEGLPKDLDGLRLAQLTDIHLGPFLSERDLARAVEMANEFRPHLALVTGDLITDRGDPLDACLRGLSRLRASEGVYGCLGNHEVYAVAEAYAAREGKRLGIDFLRGESRLLQLGQATLNLAGVDHQRMGGPYLVSSQGLARPECFNVLLSHNPDVFQVAVRQGHNLTVSGHTHGGQLTLGAGGLRLTMSQLFTSYVHGLYRQGRAAMYVSRGIGTVGIPVRLGAPPEVALIRLRAEGV